MNELNPLYSHSTTDIIVKQNDLIRKVTGDEMLNAKTLGTLLCLINL
jgi:hypothetical protein